MVQEEVEEVKNALDKFNEIMLIDFKNCASTIIPSKLFMLVLHLFLKAFGK